MCWALGRGGLGVGAGRNQARRCTGRRRHGASMPPCTAQAPPKQADGQAHSRTWPPQRSRHVVTVFSAFQLHMGLMQHTRVMISRVSSGGAVRPPNPLAAAHLSLTAIGVWEKGVWGAGVEAGAFRPMAVQGLGDGPPPLLQRTVVEAQVDADSGCQQRHQRPLLQLVVDDGRVALAPVASQMFGLVCRAAPTACMCMHTTKGIAWAPADKQASASSLSCTQAH